MLTPQLSTVRVTRMQLFTDPTIAAAVTGGLVFLLALKVAAYVAVRRVMKPVRVRRDDERR